MSNARPAGYPQACERTVRTRDGVEYRIRPIRPDDLEREYEFVRSLSHDALYNRLMYEVHEPTDALIRPLVNIDYERHMALVAVDTDACGAEHIIGVARYAVDAQRAEHEFAVAVTDAWQGRGIGTTLLRDLFAYARGRGLRRLGGTVFPGNERMLALARRMGLELSINPDDPSLIRIAKDFGQPP